MTRTLRTDIRFLLIAAVCIPLYTAAGEAPIVFAHYMPWFRAEATKDGGMIWEHWQWFGKGPKHDPDSFLENGKRDIASVYYPLIGPYDGRDPDVLEYHCLTAKAAGIQGFVADWNGPESFTDDVFELLLRAVERYGLKAGICLEEKAFFPDYSKATTRAEAMDVMETHMRHVLDEYATSPNYLRFEERPVFLIFNGYQDGILGRHVLTPEEVGDVLQRFAAENPMYLRTHYDKEYNDVITGHYSWVGDLAYKDWFFPFLQNEKAEGRTSFYVGSANPGFNDAGVWGWGDGPRFTDRKGTLEYEDWWQRAIEVPPDAMQIVTWNDFEEGTTIEPAEEYGFTFIDLTEEYVNKFTGRRVYLEDNQWPLRIYRLRKSLSSVEYSDARARAALALDAFAGDLARGRRFLMGWRLNRLERDVDRITGGAEE